MSTLKAPRTLRETANATTTSLTTKASARTAFNQIDKGQARKRLSEDQGGRCAFCMDRIDPTSREGDGNAAIRIAHWMPIDSKPSLALDWKNLLGSCSSRVSCDVGQKQAVLATNPTVVGHIAKLDYETVADTQGNVRILLTSSDSSTSADIKVLGLNEGDLPANRHGAWKTFFRLFVRAKTGTYGRPAWRAFFESQTRNPHQLPPYLGVVEAKLR